MSLFGWWYDTRFKQAEAGVEASKTAPEGLVRAVGAHLSVPYLAVRALCVEPLPHQITAVYGGMLRRQPLSIPLSGYPISVPNRLCT